MFSAKSLKALASKGIPPHPRCALLHAFPFTRSPAASYDTSPPLHTISLPFPPRSLVPRHTLLAKSALDFIFVTLTLFPLPCVRECVRVRFCEWVRVELIKCPCPLLPYPITLYVPAGGYSDQHSPTAWHSRGCICSVGQTPMLGFPLPPQPP